VAPLPKPKLLPVRRADPHPGRSRSGSPSAARDAPKSLRSRRAASRSQPPSQMPGASPQRPHGGGFVSRPRLSLHRLHSSKGGNRFRLGCDFRLSGSRGSQSVLATSICSHGWVSRGSENHLWITRITGVT
jgi:hypothetical protein